MSMSFSTFSKQWKALFTEDDLTFNDFPPNLRSKLLKELSRNRLKHCAAFTKNNGLERAFLADSESHHVCQYLMYLLASSRDPTTLISVASALERQVQHGLRWAMSCDQVGAIALNLGLKPQFLPNFCRYNLPSFVQMRAPGVVVTFDDHPPYIQLQQFLHCLLLLLDPVQFASAWSPDALDLVFSLLVAMLIDDHVQETMLHLSAMSCLDRLFHCYPDTVWNSGVKSQELISRLSGLPECVWRPMLEWMPRRGRGLVFRRLTAYCLIQKLNQTTEVDQPAPLKVGDVLELVRSYHISVSGDEGELRRCLLLLFLMDMAVGSERIPTAEKPSLVSMVTVVRDQVNRLRDGLDELTALRTEVKDYTLLLATKWNSLAGVELTQMTLTDLGVTIKVEK